MVSGVVQLTGTVWRRLGWITIKLQNSPVVAPVEIARDLTFELPSPSVFVAPAAAPVAGESPCLGAGLKFEDRKMA